MRIPVDILTFFPGHADLKRSFIKGEDSTHNSRAGAKEAGINNAATA